MAGLTPLSWRQEMSAYHQRTRRWASANDVASPQAFSQSAWSGPALKTDYAGVYGPVYPWTDFLNLAFSTDPSTPAPDKGFGTAMRWKPAEHYYILAGLADAIGDPGGSRRKHRRLLQWW